MGKIFINESMVKEDKAEVMHKSIRNNSPGYYDKLVSKDTLKTESNKKIAAKMMNIRRCFNVNSFVYHAQCLLFHGFR